MRFFLCQELAREVARERARAREKEERQRREEEEAAVTAELRRDLNARSSQVQKSVVINRAFFFLASQSHHEKN